MTSETSDAEMLTLLLVRETTRLQAEFLKATGWPTYLCASEIMVQAVLMMVPNVTPDQARESVHAFWKTFIADYTKKLEQVSAMQNKMSAISKLDGGVLPFVLRPPAPANDESANAPLADKNADDLPAERDDGLGEIAKPRRDEDGPL